MRIDLHELRKIIIEALLNAYDVLGLKHGASDEEIKTAWKRLALQNHPDRGGSHGKMVDINNAKTRLLDKTELMRRGAMIKGYDDPNAPAPKAGQAPKTSTSERSVMYPCGYCGRNVKAVSTTGLGGYTFVNHYTSAGGPTKCEGSKKGIYSKPSSGPTPGARPAGSPPPPRGSTAVGNRRYFEYRAGTSSKFWEIETVGAYGAEVKVRWGRIGSEGSVNVKSFGGNVANARKWRRAMINSKLSKGYVEVTPAPGRGAAPPPPAANTAAGAAAGASPRPSKDSYKVYGWRQGRRVVRVGGKLYGTGTGGRVMDPTSAAGGYQTRFNANDRAQVTKDGNRMKVKKPDSDHTQTWDPIDEVRQVIDDMVIDMLVEIARR